MAQAHHQAHTGGAEIGKRDVLRHLIEIYREAYDIAAYPPAIAYGPAGNVDREPMDDMLERSRSNLLNMGIDAKMLTESVTESLNEARAQALINWLLDSSEYGEYTLSHKKRLFLKYDRLTLKEALGIKKGGQNSHA